MTAEPALQVRDLVVRFGDVTAVDGVTFTAARGAITAVLGANGAGKTTTLETCEGFRRPTGGSVRVLGQDPAARRGDLRARVGVMLQDAGVPATARPGEALDAAAALYAHPHRPAELLEVLDLHRVARTPFRRLSGGEQQRVKLALALVGRPELVVADEPSSGLDPHARIAVWQLLAGLRDAGVSVVLTTHLMDEAETLADHVVIMNKGHVVAAGAPAQLVGDADAQLRFRAPLALDLTDLARALPDGVTVSEDSPGHYRVAGAVGPQAIAAVTAWCAARGVLAADLSLGHRSLQDVFVALTGQDAP